LRCLGWCLRRRISRLAAARVRVALASPHRMFLPARNLISGYPEEGARKSFTD
jgi:hypothetical protein